MNTLAKLYKHSLSLFYSDPASEHTSAALTELVSACAMSPHPVATVDIINRHRVKEAHQVFWQTLETRGLSVRFVPRKDPFAFVVLQALPPAPIPTGAAPLPSDWQVAA